MSGRVEPVNRNQGKAPLDLALPDTLLSVALSRLKTSNFNRDLASDDRSGGVCDALLDSLQKETAEVKAAYARVLSAYLDDELPSALDLVLIPPEHLDRLPRLLLRSHLWTKEAVACVASALQDYSLVLAPNEPNSPIIVEVAAGYGDLSHGLRKLLPHRTIVASDCRDAPRGSLPSRTESGYNQNILDRRQVVHVDFKKLPKGSLHDILGVTKDRLIIVIGSFLPAFDMDINADLPGLILAKVQPAAMILFEGYCRDKLTTGYLSKRASLGYEVERTGLDQTLYYTGHHKCFERHRIEATVAMPRCAEKNLERHVAAAVMPIEKAIGHTAPRTSKLTAVHSAVLGITDTDELTHLGVSLLKVLDRGIARSAPRRVDVGMNPPSSIRADWELLRKGLAFELAVQLTQVEEEVTRRYQKDHVRFNRPIGSYSVLGGTEPPLTPLDLYRVCEDHARYVRCRENLTAILSLDPKKIEGGDVTQLAGHFGELSELAFTYPVVDFGLSSISATLEHVLALRPDLRPAMQAGTELLCHRLMDCLKHFGDSGNLRSDDYLSTLSILDWNVYMKTLGSIGQQGLYVARLNIEDTLGGGDQVSESPRSDRVKVEMALVGLEVFLEFRKNARFKSNQDHCEVQTMAKQLLQVPLTPAQCVRALGSIRTAKADGVSSDLIDKALTKLEAVG